MPATAAGRTEVATLKAISAPHAGREPLIAAGRGEASIHELVGKKIMMVPHETELIAYLQREGVPLDRIVQVPHSFNPDDVLKGRVATASGYSTDEPYLLKKAGMPVQISMSVARHNADQLPAMLELVRALGADALDTFLLVPVCCGVELAASEMLRPEEYERLLHWCCDQAAESGVELHASCAPHYSRIVEQRRENGSETTTAAAEGIGPTDIMMPGINGKELADRFMIARPDAKAIFMSGRAAEVISDAGVLIPVDAFLAKPFTVERLLNKVRERLEYRSPFSRPR